MGNTQNRPQGQSQSSSSSSSHATRERREEDCSSSKTADDEFTCEICIEPTPSDNKFNNNNLCVHPFCSACMSMYIDTKVQDNVAGHIPCPDLACDKLLDPLTARAILSRKVFDKWCDNLCNSALQGLKTCYCPYQDCSVLVVEECAGRPRKTSCPSCKRLFCFHCKRPWEGGHQCGEILNLGDENDKKFLEVATCEHWIRCPGCGHYVHRIEGCRRLVCRCGTTFCYDCGGRHPCKCDLEAAEDRRLSFSDVVILIICVVVAVGSQVPVLLYELGII